MNNALLLLNKTVAERQGICAEACAANFGVSAA